VDHIQALYSGVTLAGMFNVNLPAGVSLLLLNKAFPKDTPSLFTQACLSTVPPKPSLFCLLSLLYFC